MGNYTAIDEEEPKEECGIAAVYLGSKKKEDAIFYLYKLLLNLQNRGQLSAGITTYDKNKSQLIETYRDIGNVNEVFKTNNPLKNQLIFRKYSGNKGIGHVRYATFGKDDKRYAQPFERQHGRMWKWFSFCFNGNLANYAGLKDMLMKKTGYHTILDTDTEIIMHYIARELMGSKKPNLVKVFSSLSKKFDGAYNIMLINAYGDMAVARDPIGFRPLSYSIANNKLLAASESNALINCGAEDFRSLEPGKMILVKDNKIEIRRFAKSKRTAHCMFEYVYFSNVSSVLDGSSVYRARTNLGKNLAKLETENITEEHIVVPVPDTAKAAGDAMAFELGIRSEEGLIRNRFIGRTFIEGYKRGDKVKNKYTALREVLKGKKVILVDDSIVRGATCKKIVRYLKKFGKAKEVHLRVSCPPIMCPCFYGIDMSTVSELFAPKYGKLNNGGLSEKTRAKMARALGADSLIYQTIPGLIKSIGLPKDKLCMACLNGDYPTPWGRKMHKEALKNLRTGKKGRTYEAECG